jgi:hypothetical protein
MTSRSPDAATEVAALEAAELAAGALAGVTLVVSWFYGFRLAFTTHRVYGAFYPGNTYFQDHQLFRTDLGAGLAVVGLGTLLAALTLIVFFVIRTLLTPRRVALRQAERERQAHLAQDGL